MRSVTVAAGVLGLSMIAGCNGTVPGIGSVDASPVGDVGVDSTGPDAALGSVAITIANRPTDAMTFGFLVAYQDGAQAWKLAPAPVGDVYTIPNGSGKYAVAWTCLAGATVMVDATYATVTEHAALVVDDLPIQCTDRTVTITGTVAPLAATMTYTAMAGGAIATVTAGGAYSLTVPPGTYDVVIAEAATATPTTPDKLAIVRAVAATANVTTDVDFATAVAPQTQVATVTLGTGESAVVQSVLRGSSTVATLSAIAATPFETMSLSAGQGLATDDYDQTISVTDATTGAFAQIALTSAAPAPIAYTAPTPMGAITTTVPTTAPVSVRSAWTAYTGAVGYVFEASQSRTAPCGAGAGACVAHWTAHLSAGWLSTVTSYSTPDLTALTGWNPTLDLATGKPVTVDFEAMTSSGGAADFPFGVPAAGTARALAMMPSTVTP